MSAGENGTYDKAALERLFSEQLRLTRIGTWREAAANVLMIARTLELDERTAKVLSDAFDAYAASLEADWMEAAARAQRRQAGRWTRWIRNYLPGLAREEGKGST